MNFGMSCEWTRYVAICFSDPRLDDYLLVLVHRRPHSHEFFQTFAQKPFGFAVAIKIVFRANCAPAAICLLGSL